MRWNRTCLIAAVLVATISWGRPAAAIARAVVDLVVYPPNVQLSTREDRQTVLVQAVYDDRTTRDVTSEATFQVEHPDLVRLDQALFTPLRDGATTATVTWGERTCTLPVEVQQAEADRPVRFSLDVMPVLMKADCNTGSCHGSARGQDGFNLSLFGFDPDGDYHRITREQNGRRINLALPGDSLLLLKAVGKVPHTGGELFSEDSELYRTLLRWIDGRAQSDPEDTPRPIGLELYPKQIVLEGPGDTHQLSARVKYSDGTDRDITSTAVFITSNDQSAEVSDLGRITAGRRGEAFVMARYDVYTEGVPVIVVPRGETFTFPELPEHNYIDTLVHNKLRKLRIRPSDPCSDEAFLRRASLDIIGLTPDRAAYEAFAADTSPDKRARLVDELLERKEFVELWVMKWAELLQIRSNNDFSYKSALLYYNWLQEQIANGRPFNEVVRDLLGSSGGTFKSPPTNYYQIEDDMLKVSENVAQVFLGMRMQCTQCHNHPFDRWTMDDYYGFAAFFSQIGRKKAEDPRETVVFNKNNGEVKHPVSQQNVAPRFLGGTPADTGGRDRREVMAEWLSSPDNPYFTRNLANMIWAHFFGRGIVEPVDDVRISNPPSNAELLQALNDKLVEYNYDFKKLVRDICTSRTYQLSTRTNPTNELDESNFSHAMVRRIRAEVLLDSISQVTETKNKFKGLPLGARAVQIADGNVSNYFLTTFGRASRETVCSCEVVMEPNLSQALHLLNGDATHRKIQQGQVVKTLLAQGSTPADIIDELYIRCLTRPPSETEKTALLAQVQDPGDHQAVLEDTFWALLNAKEFIFNH